MTPETQLDFTTLSQEELRLSARAYLTQAGLADTPYPRLSQIPRGPELFARYRRLQQLRPQLKAWPQPPACSRCWGYIYSQVYDFAFQTYES